MGHPKDIKTVALDGHSLTLESFVAAARYGAAVEHIIAGGGGVIVAGK